MEDQVNAHYFLCVRQIGGDGQRAGRETVSTSSHVKFLLPGSPGHLAFLRSSHEALLLRDFSLKPIQYLQEDIIAPFAMFLYFIISYDYQ